MTSLRPFAYANGLFMGLCPKIFDFPPHIREIYKTTGEFKVFKFDLTNKKPHIHIFGAGGTGGFALEFLTRLFAGSEITIDVYDGDTVENKNLKRQNFTTNDLDLSKVDALINRLQHQVPEPPTFVPHTEYIVDSDELLAEVLSTTEDDEQIIFVLAVDNIATRRLINKTITDLSDIDIDVIALDSGNHDQGGQVVLYNNFPIMEKDILGNETATQLKSMLELYPEIDVINDINDENPGLVANCAEDSESKPQSMMANVRNGELLASIIYQIYQNQAFAHNVWTSDILTGNTTATRKL